MLLLFILLKAGQLKTEGSGGIGLRVCSFFRFYKHFYTFFHRPVIKDKKTCKNMICDRRSG